MKHKIVTGVCILATLALIVLAASTWHTQTVQERVKQAQSYAKQQYVERARQAAVEAEKQRVLDECLKLQSTYDAQTAATKKLTPRPECDLEEVQ